MQQKVKQYIKEHNMLQIGDKIVVAVSGGADSFSLLHILHNLKNEYNLTLYCAHINHCLRGAESDQDEECVQKFCESLNIPFYSKRVNIEEISLKENVSTETAGRLERYKFFEEILTKFKCNKIALAHNSNDVVETVFMRIFRGAGLEGLRGILPVRDEIFIRPILCCDRDEIESYCNFEKLPYRNDSSNFEKIYTRNKIRLDLIPYIKENFNGNIISTVNRMVESLSEDYDFINKEVELNYNKYCKKNNGVVVIDKNAKELHKAILSRIIRSAIKQVLGHLKNIESSHVDSIIKLFENSTGKKLVIPNNILIENIYGDINICINEKRENKTLNFIIQKNEIECIKNPIYIEGIMKVKFEVINNEKYHNIKSKDELTKYFDYDKLKNEISLRYRVDGDEFKPLGMSGRKKLKKYYIDQKITRELRDQIPLLCFDNDIAWVIGYRTSEDYKVDKNTSNVLKIVIEKE